MVFILFVNDFKLNINLDIRKLKIKNNFKMN